VSDWLSPGEEAALTRELLASQRRRRAQFQELRAMMNRTADQVAEDRYQDELLAYRDAAVAACRDPNPGAGHWGILDELVDQVHGGSRAEIDASVADMMARTRSVIESLPKELWQ
jgi:hypothetical protein